jgi:hypothetical protein
MPTELGRRLSAGVGIVHGSSEPRADHDRDLVEFHSLLAQRLAVAVP